LESGDLLYLTENDTVEAVTSPRNLMHCFSVNFTPRYLTPKKKINARESGSDKIIAGGGGGGGGFPLGEPRGAGGGGGGGRGGGGGGGGGG
jgi:hypothetical protein